MTWWNFIGRSADDIVQVRTDWEQSTRFGTLEGYAGDRLSAPAFPRSP
ncbi:hypothetical protein [Streptomyces carpaticus]